MNDHRTIRQGQSGYTMVELMVAVLISIILMVAMYQIFARTQKIFTEGHHRGKMYEEGRAVMDIILRDLEQVAPTGLAKAPWTPGIGTVEWWGGYHPFRGCNFMAMPNANLNFVLKAADRPNDYSGWRPETQQLWDAAVSEPLVSSRVEFFAKEVDWRLLGYRLYSQNNPIFPNQKIIGTLWRYESSRGPVGDLDGKSLALRNNGDSMYQKLSDNVIHFCLRAVSRTDPGRVLWSEPVFDGNQVPRCVEVELGIIEERLKEEILNDAEVERYEVALESDPSNKSLMIGRNARVMKMLAANTDRILMLRQIVFIPYTTSQ